MYRVFWRKLMAAILMLCILALAACGPTAPPAATARKLTVAVTIAPEHTFVQAVCGNLVNVITLIPTGSDPETYEPTSAILQSFSTADIYFPIGLPAENSTPVTTAQKDKAIKIVPLQDAVSAVYPDIALGGLRDPYTWLSLKRAKVMVQTIANEMSALDPDHAETYAQNASAYLAKLDITDQEVHKRLSRLLLSSLQTRHFVAIPPVLRYFADEYDLTMEVLAKEGQEATEQEIQQAINLAKAQNVKAIFYTAQTDSRIPQAFAKALDGKAIIFDPLAADYTGNLLYIANAVAQTTQ